MNARILIGQHDSIPIGQAARSGSLAGSLRDSATINALQAIAVLNHGGLAAIVPPLGYGRDGSQTKWQIFNRH